MIFSWTSSVVSKKILRNIFLAWTTITSDVCENHDSIDFWVYLPNNDMIMLLVYYFSRPKNYTFLEMSTYQLCNLQGRNTLKKKNNNNWVHT